jgi:adenine-specific DNA-methyltransferase
MYFGKDGNAIPARIQYLKDIEGIVPWTWWPHEEVGHTDEARKEIQDILETQTAFTTPKPVRLIERILRIATKPGDLVLDFFAGSGTTAQAVLNLNAEDGGKRRFILVSNSEVTEDEPDKNLCRDVCAERVRRVMRGFFNRKGDDIPGLGSGFAYLTTRLHPRHRLDVRLDHGQVWRALQMLHDHPVADGAAIPLSWSSHNSHNLAYLTNMRAESVTRLKERLAGSEGEIVVYSWAADRLEALLPGVTIRPIPQTLADRFGRRKNSSRNNGA